jgi:translocator protein|tara:strand:- start:1438 stop:1890 length:453 start_codon:yes stop_codon:yes gene_type:complete
MKKYKLEIFFALVCLVLGMISGSISTANSSQWYNNLSKSFFTPPGFVFPIAWTLLYLLMGITLAKIYKEKKITLLNIFTTQMILNLLWSPLFFYSNSIFLALIDLIALWICIAIFICLSWKNRFISLSFIPYFLWVSFALFLNYNIYIFN